MLWSELQRSDKVMCFVALVGGIIALVETLLHMIDLLEFWSFNIITEVIALVLAIIAILLGIKPIQYTPTILTVIGILLIIFGSWIGGIIVLLAAILGIIT
ncbi:MAG: hypothetical protein ACFFDY_05795 [Candidatus Thorarchaeota archaeon]